MTDSRLQNKLDALPDKPGCYLMRDRYGHIIYVGKAASLRKRVQSYFRKATRRNAPPKLRGLIKSIADIDIIELNSEAEALIREGELIKAYRPRYNVTFKDDKRYLLISVDLTEPFPRFKLCRLRKNDRATFFGPYPSSRAARATVEFMEKHYGIRKCRPRIPTPEHHRHCVNDIVRFCSAPCTGSVSPEEYMERVQAACAFLRGEDHDAIHELRERMEQASSDLDFELAAAMRDTIELVRQVIEQRIRGTRTPAQMRDAAMTGTEELKRALDLPRRPALIETFDVSCISGTHAVASMVVAVDGMPHPERYRHFRIRTVHQADDPAMMAETISRRFSRLLRENRKIPDLVVVDGGITQLRAARSVLKSLSLQNVTVIGLAKRYEEVHREISGKADLVRLPRESQALKVLQRIRDEAHRFALAYHRKLRRKRISESLLDDIPGIGSSRKTLLLKHFGSVARISKASIDEITAVPGIGPETAATILDALR